MKQWAEHFYKSTAWKKCRNTYMSMKGGLCEDCYKEGKIVPAEEVHHIVELNPQNINDPNITMSHGNLAALCRECHRRRHGAAQKRYEVDEWGRVIPLERSQ